MLSITRSGNEAIGTHVIYSESEEVAAPSASMLGMPMTPHILAGHSSQ